MADEETVGEVHIVFRPDRNVELSTNLDVPELNLALDTIKALIISGDLHPEMI